MNATNVRRLGTTCISTSTIVHCTEYAVKLPERRARIPIYEMTDAPKSDRQCAGKSDPKSVGNAELYQALFNKGYTVTEVAQICGKSKSTVSAMLKKAREGRAGTRKKRAASWREPRTEIVECPYGPSCFDCPLPDCKVKGAFRYNALANETPDAPTWGMGAVQ